MISIEARQPVAMFVRLKTVPSMALWSVIKITVLPHRRQVVRARSLPDKVKYQLHGRPPLVVSRIDSALFQDVFFASENGFTKPCHRPPDYRRPAG
jgi:hypothetical protein